MAEVASTTLSLRISAPRRDLIDRGARAAGKTRTDFILDSATHAAEEALLDQRLFQLDGDDHAAFVAALDAPPRELPELRRLLADTPPWER